MKEFHTIHFFKDVFLSKTNTHFSSNTFNGRERKPLSHLKRSSRSLTHTIFVRHYERNDILPIQRDVYVKQMTAKPNTPE